MRDFYNGVLRGLLESETWGLELWRRGEENSRVVWSCGLVAARDVLQGSGCGSSNSLGSHLVGAHGPVGSRFLGGVLQDSSSDDEAARPKPAKVPRGNKGVAPAPVGIVCESSD
jgi:hypothetical protein